MTASRIPSRAGEPTALVSPVIDYEPPPVGVRPPPDVSGPAAQCRPPTPRQLRRRAPRPSPSPSGGPHLQRATPVTAVREAPPPRAAVLFADAALRRVLETIDRRRPVAQLRPLLAPGLTDTVVALTRSTHTGAATLRRVRLRMVDDGSDITAAEVFGTYTRGRRIRAIAARIALNGDRWRVVALQIG